MLHRGLHEVCMGTVANRAQMFTNLVITQVSFRRKPNVRVCLARAPFIFNFLIQLPQLFWRKPDFKGKCSCGFKKPSSIWFRFPDPLSDEKTMTVLLYWPVVFNVVIILPIAASSAEIIPRRTTWLSNSSWTAWQNKKLLCLLIFLLFENDSIEGTEFASFGSSWHYSVIFPCAFYISRKNVKYKQTATAKYLMISNLLPSIFLSHVHNQG